MRPYRVAIIGTGAIAATHMEALRHAGERVEVVAAVDVDEARVREFCARHNIPRSYTNRIAMLADIQPDLAHICAPPATHLNLILEALEAGAWVWCEKPLCASLAEFDQIEAAVARAGGFVSPVFQWRFGSAARHLKQLIAGDELGRPLLGICHTLWYRDEAYYRVPWRGKWTTELGGPTMGHGIHLMDLLLWLLGDWREVQAIMGTLDRSIETEDISMALVRFDNGAMGSIVNSVLSPRQESHLRLDFQRVTVEAHALYSYTNANWRYSLPEGVADEESFARWRYCETDTPATHTAQLMALLDSLERKERPLVSGAEARRVLEFIASLYKSAFTGRPVARGSITPEDPFYYAMNGIPQHMERI